jgi:uracil-DNA glycosylase family 4
MTPERATAARDLLAFYLEAGADALVGETPVDRFAEPAPAPVSGASAPETTAREAIEARPPSKIRTTLPPKGVPAEQRPAGPAPPSPEAAVMAARAAAKSAATLEELRAILERFDGCALKTTAKQLVFADGTPGARVMFVGEAPGRDEDIEGLPFVGRSGKLLDRIAAAIGLDRTSFYIANIVPWRPPGNRTPTPQESQICLPFILRQIELANPDVLVCLGGPSAQTLLGVTEGIMRTRGRWFTFNTGAREIKAIATLHPAYLLRQPLAKRQVWQDFLKIRQALDAPKQ